MMDHTGYTEAWAKKLYERDGGSIKGHATVLEYIKAELGFMQPTDDEIEFLVRAYDQAKRENATVSDAVHEKALERMGNAGEMLPMPGDPLPF